MVALLRDHGLKGWRRHQPLPRRLDFIFQRGKVAVFVDGCFWHGCPDCYRAPKSNQEFWRNKIEGNRRRDRRVARHLRLVGWCVIRNHSQRSSTAAGVVSYVAKGLLPYHGLGSGIKRALQQWPQIEFTDDHDGRLFRVTVTRNPIIELDLVVSDASGNEKIMNRRETTANLRRRARVPGTVGLRRSCDLMILVVPGGAAIGTPLGDEPKVRSLNHLWPHQKGV